MERPHRASSRLLCLGGSSHGRPSNRLVGGTAS
jgi:hypothetical protein